MAYVAGKLAADGEDLDDDLEQGDVHGNQVEAVEVFA
jgi:hypothetical protein